MINNIIPTPKRVELSGGVSVIPFSVSCDEVGWCEYVKTLPDAFLKLYKSPLTVCEGGIILKKDDTLPMGSYKIDSRDGIVLSAKDDEGILYAIATLIQAAEVKDGKITVECAIIEDYADKDYRSLMVDLAREWHPASTVLQYIDLCFMLKVKYLHLHFIDNERYTLPSKAFPKLNVADSYTYAEIEEMRARAKSRGIVIVPEFEAPGHAAMLSRSYPEIFANEVESVAADEKTELGALITDESIICAGKPETMEGVYTLLKEVCELFPDSPYIHIGGDEAKIAVWNYCSHCKSYMQEKGIEDVYELYSEFVGRVAKMVIEMGRTPIVWEGFPKKGVSYIPKETIVIAWETMYHMPYDLIAEGFKVINSSWMPMYIVPNPEPRFNWGINEILNWNVYNWQHWYEHSAAYNNPINVAPTEQVIGATLCLWECTFEWEISRCLNNLTALSDRVWNTEGKWSGLDFFHRAKPTIHRISRYIQSV